MKSKVGKCLLLGLPYVALSCKSDLVGNSKWKVQRALFVETAMDERIGTGMVSGLRGMPALQASSWQRRADRPSRA